MCGKFRTSENTLNDYMNEFYELLENARQDSFIGQYKNDDATGSSLD